MKESNAIKGFSFFTMSAGVRWNQAETYQRGLKKGTIKGLMIFLTILDDAIANQSEGIVDESSSQKSVIDN
jgi:hypothetical protein